GLEEAERAERLAGRAGGDAPVGAREHGGEIVAAERLLGRAAVEGGGAARLLAALEMLGEREGVDLAGALEPRAGEPVAERAIRVGQRAVGGLAHERVAERELALGREARGAALRDELAVREGD